MDGFTRMRGEYVDKFDTIFKTLTTDNGSEFARLQELEAISETLVYYAHLFSSWEKRSTKCTPPWVTGNVQNKLMIKILDLQKLNHLLNIK